MKLTLLCERCKIRGVETKIGVFEYKDITWPLDVSVFKSWDKQLLPDPFPVGMVDDWKWARCRQCGSRPFLNFIPQSQRKVMLIDGSRVAKGLEGRLLTLEKGYIPIRDYPNAPEVVVDEDGNFGEVYEKLTSGPVECPKCGKVYQSQANMDRYHTNCEGVKDDGHTEPNTDERGVPA